MITPAYGLTATERVLPSFVLDWTTGLVQDAVGVARTGVATFVGPNGLIQSAAENTQRVDYSTGIAGILVEESRTNILPYSQDFDDTATAGATRPWVWSRATVSKNVTTAPDGTATGSKLVEDTTATDSHQISQDKAFTTGFITESVFVKPDERTFVQLYFSDFVASSAVAVFNLTTKTATTTVGGSWTNPSTKIDELVNGWLRVSFTVEKGAGTSVRAYIALSNGSTISYTGDGYSGIYIWGASLEEGEFQTSYIPTATAAVTRNADVATVTGTNFSDWFNPTEGTFAAQIVCANDIDNAYYYSVNNGTASEMMAVRRFTGGVTSALVIDNGSEILGIGSPNTFTENVPFRSTFAYKLNNSAVSAIGSSATIDTSVTIPTVDRMNIGSRNSGLNSLNGWVQKLEYYPQRLVNNEVQAFSK